MQFTLRVFRPRLSIRMCSLFPFGFEGGVLALIALVPDHTLSLFT